MTRTGSPSELDFAVPVVTQGELIGPLRSQLVREQEAGLASRVRLELVLPGSGVPVVPA